MRGTLFALLLLMTLVFSRAISNAQTDEDSILLFLPAFTNPKVSVTKTIPPEGGSIRAGKISVVFAAGTFGQPTAVTVRSAKPGGEFGSQPDSHCFAIDINGNCFAQPVTVSFPGYGGPDRDVPLALSQSETDAAARTLAMPPNIVMGTVRGGSLSLQIPRTECVTETGVKGYPRENLSSVVYPVSGVSPRSSRHFRANVPQDVLAVYPGLDQLLLDHAESAWALLTSFDYTFDEAIHYPVNINVVHGLSTETWGLTSIPLGGKGSQYIEINAHHCTPANSTALRATVGHEFFHVVQNIYNPFTAYAINHPDLFGATFYWLSEASSVWFESYMLGNLDYVSPVFAANVVNYPRGLENYTLADGKDAQNMGYWASGFLRWFVGTRGRDVVRVMWEKARAQTESYSDLSAMIAADSSPAVMTQRWTSFMHSFLSRNTGYPGWNFPSGSDLIHFTASGPTRTFSKGIFPFSGQKWLFAANNGEQDVSYTVTALDNEPGVSYRVYTGSTSTGPFDYLTTLQLVKPQRVTLSHGKALLVTAVNASTNYPYRTPSTGRVAVNLSGQSRYCPGVPNTAVRHDTHDGKVYFFHPTQGFEIALEVYADWGSSPNYKIIETVVCSDATTGAGIFQSDYFNTGVLRAYTPLDANKKAHGVSTSYYEDRKYRALYTFAHGILDGSCQEWYANGNTSLSCEYANDARTGTWRWYNEDGSLRLTCIYLENETRCFYP